MIAFSLPYAPTANHIWHHGAGGHFRSTAYKDWQAEAQVAIPNACRGAITGPFRITIVADKPDRRKRDLDNIIKPTMDALKPVSIGRSRMPVVLPGVIRDDSDAVEIVTRWSDREPGKGARVHVSLEPA